ncbi:HAD family hydrolase [Cryobacterium fucosi]|uniref:HAD family hydrolase n=1 Tax=Cryobacterium fucosi TaxID=1259157 RepID=A0A4R9BCJ0_9MICO|nr:HAD family hydrolase [Cryobacterium fucosi]
MVVGLVVFDMDDTLFLERAYVESGFQAVSEMLAAEHNFTSFFERAWQEFQSGRRGDIFNRVLHDSASLLPSDIVDLCITSYRSHEPRIELLTDSRDFLAACRGRVRTGLITDGPRLSQQAKIRSLNLAERIERVIVTDEHREEDWAKPSPIAYASLQEWFGVRGRDCVYIGDNPRKDFISPRRLGWRTVRVRRPGGLHERVETVDDAEFEIPSLTRTSVTMIDCLEFLADEMKCAK